MKQPWNDGPLAEWSIVGMNHYHLNGEKRLFVAMTKGGLCIQEEGKDDEYLWNRLWHKALKFPRDSSGKEATYLGEGQASSL